MADLDAAIVKPTFIGLAIAAILTIGASPTSAGIAVTAKTAMPQGFRYDAAFNQANNLYLIVWDKPPVRGQLAGANGVPFGGQFQIATEANGESPYTSWSTVTAGGTAQDPAFLVTYLAVEGSVTRKYGRLVRVFNGQVSVGPRFLLAVITGQNWYAANRARVVWDADHFIVATRVDSAVPGLAGAQVQRVDLAGNASPPVFLGDTQDYESGPSLACAPTHICMATGYADGIPFGGTTAIWARLFNGQTLQPLTGLFYLDNHSSSMNTPFVVYNPKVGRFSAAWHRSAGGKVDFRQVGTDGSLGPLDLTRSFGPGAGDLGMAFNSRTGTALLVTKAGNNADLWALEIGDQGYPTGNNTLITLYDNLGWPTYSTSLTANESNGSWLVAYMLSTSGWAAAVQGTVIGNDTMRVSDFDGDARSELTVYNPSNGVWSSLKSIGGYSTATNISWGGANYLPAPGDYDGDGRSDLGVYDRSTGFWYVLLSGSGFTTTLVKNCGGEGWLPVTADYDGDGRTDLAVYNTSSGQWFGLKSSTGYTTTLNVGWGGAGFTAAPGDFDGDGKSDLGVYETSTGNWYVLLSAAGYTTALSKNVGGAGYDPVQSDFDGDGKIDFVVYNRVTGIWFGLLSGTGYTTTVNTGWGGPGYTPVRGDYDGDGRADLAVYHQGSGNWFVLLSGAGYTTALSKNWGGAGYLAVPMY